MIGTTIMRYIMCRGKKKGKKNEQRTEEGRELFVSRCSGSFERPSPSVPRFFFSFCQYIRV